MSSPDRDRLKRRSLAVALVGIAVELAAIGLLASNRLPVPVAIPIIVVGMLLAFFPLLVVRRRR